MRTTICLVFTALATLAACNGGTNTTQDMAAPRDMNVVSCCGNPGDTGNALGVGKYCTGIDDCAGNAEAKLCSSLGNTASRKTFFCTKLCDPKIDMGSQCGEGASCQCDSGGAGCACTPTKCVTSAPPGCSN
jgi:hypothetical protein